ncbi:DUF2599 domain-containing protein [Candidatus Mycobacterium wuenschmannii]|uniref:DUF2599 domain-containing protein n=1 Tax=Candidatus Mycobacterium wuenschmannii TaxID=3027808 RepID=A0ABY8VVH1_9MYCO|nr:DUF2599 domain-containing protein [Candidatus Mycobacterium wuenschmannii]WIM87301.1 DUF2599 domain-containing protein [Candidatus Mycobacterium wuenschmannii]
MRVLILAVLGAILAAAPATADPGPSAMPFAPPFVDHVAWAQWSTVSGLSSLRVYPTASGRAASKRLGSPSPEADEAWAEVLALAPRADTPGMRSQFQCHWDFAETAEPGKTSWNLEPWRPVVDDAAMVAAGCNPGGAGEPF